ncbi:3'-5' exonuclease [Vibrio fluvialis]|nr:3'-5' exonuclease [Vibrio fluvialis]
MSIHALPLSNAVILDTETTGLDSSARIVEISLINAESGLILYSGLVNPMIQIPAEATAIHGITNEDVADKPTFDVVWNEIKGLIFDKHVIVYNFDYDFRLVDQSLSDFDYPSENLLAFFRYDVCVMLWYAEFYAEINPYFNNYKWQSLTNACRQQGIDISDLTAHRALADCEMTRRLIHAVNAKIEG